MEKGEFVERVALNFVFRLLGFNKVKKHFNEYFYYKEDKQLMISTDFYWAQTWLGHVLYQIHDQ